MEMLKFTGGVNKRSIYICKDKIDVVYEDKIQVEENEFRFVTTIKIGTTSYYVSESLRTVLEMIGYEEETT